MNFIEKLKDMINPVTQQPLDKKEEPQEITPLVGEIKQATLVLTEEKPEYEVLIKDTRIFHEGTWAPVKTESIKRPENIKKYIQHGILRKINR